MAAAIDSFSSSSSSSTSSPSSSFSSSTKEEAGTSPVASSAISVSELEVWKNKASQPIEERVLAVFKSKPGLLSSVLVGSAIVIHNTTENSFENPFWMISKIMTALFGGMGFITQGIIESSCAQSQEKVAKLWENFAKEANAWQEAIPKPSQGDTFSADDTRKIVSFLSKQTPFNKHGRSIDSYISWEARDLSDEERSLLKKAAVRMKQLDDEVRSYRDKFFTELRGIDNQIIMIFLTIHVASQILSGEEKEFFEIAKKEYLKECAINAKACLAKKFTPFASFAQSAYIRSFYSSSQESPTLPYHPLQEKAFSKEVWDKLKAKTDNPAIKQKLDVLAEGSLIDPSTPLPSLL
ncbi:MAG: hypothetical protein HYZ47_02095 [Simkania negevensis]|nr:hypothetical protein [Simkania negevensis]